MNERDAVRNLGLTIGFGRLMQLSVETWQAYLKSEAMPLGGEFTIGPCAASVVPCSHPVKSRHGHCDVCCGNGFVTKWVAENMLKAR